jgi:hypothetical protein
MTGDADEFRRDWISLLDLLEAARKDLRRALETTSEDQRREAAREYWKILGLLFDHYRRRANWKNGTPSDLATIAVKPELAIPPIVARNLANLLLTLGTGVVPETMLDVVGPGAAGIGPYEETDHITAAIYVHAAKRGVLADRAPVKRVAEAFGVSRETVRNWCNAHPDIDSNPHLNPSLVEEAMLIAGARYRQVGRGEAAVRKRARKRR